MNHNFRNKDVQKATFFNHEVMRREEEKMVAFTP